MSQFGNYNKQLEECDNPFLRPIKLAAAILNAVKHAREAADDFKSLNDELKTFGFEIKPIKKKTSKRKPPPPPPPPPPGRKIKEGGAPPQKPMNKGRTLPE